MVVELSAKENLSFAFTVSHCLSAIFLSLPITVMTLKGHCCNLAAQLNIATLQKDWPLHFIYSCTHLLNASHKRPRVSSLHYNAVQ